MSRIFRPWKIDEPQLLPASAQDFVGEDHLARFSPYRLRKQLPEPVFGRSNQRAPSASS
jgi:hypothetical protein